MIKSVCGYCGVGCGLEFDEKRLIGNIDYPVNAGAICAKGASELSTIQTSTRLLRPHARHTLGESFSVISWEKAIERIAYTLRSTEPSKIGFYLSGQLLTEDYYVANKLAKGYLGTANIDTNSRTCMASAVVAHKKAFGMDYVPVDMSDIDKADLLILTGANTAEAHVVLHNRIKKAKKQGLKVIVIDPRFTESAKIADLHLPLRPGSDIDFYNLLAKFIIDNDLVDHDFIHSHVEGFERLKNHLKRFASTKALKRTGLSTKQFDTFTSLYKQSKRIITCWTMGLNQSVQGVDKNLALINTHLITGQIFKEGCGPFSLTGQPNAMGGREVGGLSSMLAVHLDFDEESIAKVSQFWGVKSIANQPGLTATEMLFSDLEILIIAHTDPVYHLPNRKRVEKALRKIPLIIEINAYDDSASRKFAHIKLPAAPWGEKEGTQTNLDRTLTKQERLTRQSIDCKPDWEIFQLIAQRLGFKEGFNFDSPKAIFEEYQEMTKLSPQGHLNVYETNYEDLSIKPFQWGNKIREEKKFFTPSGKAHLFAVENKLHSERTSLQYPFLLLTGRIRDQWHSGTKTGFVTSLLKHRPLDFVEIHPDDAITLGIKEGDKVTISSLRGKIHSFAHVTDTLRKGNLFLPLSKRDINVLTSDLLDPLSKEPDYNHSAVKIEKYLFD